MIFSFINEVSYYHQPRSNLGFDRLNFSQSRTRFVPTYFSSSGPSHYSINISVCLGCDSENIFISTSSKEF